MPIKNQRWSVASLIKLSMYAAVNFAVFSRVGRVLPHFFVVGLLSALNLLFFGLARSRRRRADRKFWDAFELAGWAIIGLNFSFVDSTISLINAPIEWLVDQEWIRRDRTESSMIRLLYATLVFGIGPLAAATLAGWLASRHGKPASVAEIEISDFLKTTNVTATPSPAVEDPRWTRDS